MAILSSSVAKKTLWDEQQEAELSRLHEDCKDMEVQGLLDSFLDVRFILSYLVYY